MNTLKIVSNIDTKTLEESSKNQLDEIFTLFSEMNVAGIEPLLEEKLNEDDKKPSEHDKNLNKYQVLTIIRDIFLEYKKSGDTSVIIETGKCGSNCYPGSVFNLQGNISKKNFSFIINKTNGLIKEVHYCSLFSTNDNKRRKPDLEMYINTLKKQSEFEGIPDDGRYDTEDFRVTVETMFENAWKHMTK